MSDVLAPFVESIDLACSRLRHGLGWRFLYTPARTLDPESRLAFVGLNPGGHVYQCPKPSVEAGNAYRIEIEEWPARGQGLQKQVRLLYNALAERVEGTSAEDLMDKQTLALNFCPFRSPKWELLVSKAESIAFSRRMWASVLDIVEPSVIVCLGRPPMENLELVLQDRCAALTDRVVRPIYWGDGRGGSYTYEVARYTTTRGKVTMVYIPHLSHFGIFGRPESQHAANEIVDTISAALATFRPTELLGSERKQYLGERNLKTLVPSIVGQAEEARIQKVGGRSPSVDVDWDFYEEQFQPERLAMVREIYERMKKAISDLGLSWQPKLKPEYLFFCWPARCGIALYKKQPIAFWIKLPRPPEELRARGYDVPDLYYPELKDRWVSRVHEWHWQVPTLEAIPDIRPAAELTRRIHRLSRLIGDH